MLAEPVPRPFSPRGCKGRSPLHEKTINPPPSRREERSASAGRGLSFPFGEGGQKSKLQAGVVGDKEGKPLAGYYSGRGCQCRFRLRRGDARGGAPCIRKLKSPLPAGKGVGGMGAGESILPLRGRGQKSKLKAGAASDQEGKPPPGTCPAGSARAASGSGAGMQGAEPLA